MAVYQSLSVTQVSQNQQENTSRVRILWQSTQTGGSYNDTRRTARYTVSCNGEPAQTYQVSYTLPMQSTAVILDVTVTVPHNSKGDGTVEVSTWMNTNISAGVVELSQKLQLDAIAQAGTVRATDSIIGGISRLAITKKSSEHTHSIAYAFGTLTGYVDGNGQVQQEEIRFSQDSVDFSVPLSFYDQIPHAKEGSCSLTLRTYMADTLVGEPQSTVFTVSAEEAACVPAVTGTVIDTNEMTKALTGDESVLVRSCSHALCTLTAQAKHGAVITKKTIAGVAVEDNTLAVAAPQMEKVVFSAEDSRGYVNQNTVEIPMIPYQSPKYEVNVNRTDSVGGNASLYVSGNWYQGSFGKEENALSVAYSTDGETYTTVESLDFSGDRFFASASLTGMAYSRVYVITVRVQDRLCTEEKQAVLKKSLPVFDWGEQNFNFHVPVQMDSPLSLQSGGTGCGDWENQYGVIVKHSANTMLTAVQPASGAFYAAGSDAIPQFGVLPVAQGGTGGTDAAQACDNLGLILPMEPGVEYVTHQRWMGKPVYTKLVEYGNLPVSSAKAVPHGAAATQVIGCRGTMSCGKTLPWGGIHAYRADLFCDTESIYIDTEKDYSDQTAVVQLWYIK